jgi:hypothetical protein
MGRLNILPPGPTAIFWPAAPVVLARIGPATYRAEATSRYALSA